MSTISTAAIVAAGSVLALATAFCTAGVIEMAGVESAAAQGCDAPKRVRTLEERLLETKGQLIVGKKLDDVDECDVLVGTADARAAYDRGHGFGAQETPVWSGWRAPAPRADTTGSPVYCAGDTEVIHWTPPADTSDLKIKKDGSGGPPALQFIENPDILATLAHSPRAQSGELYCVGFAAESHDLLANATAKRLRGAC